MKSNAMPGNNNISAVSDLLLDNEMFTQKQNNVRNSESVLKLDTSAIEDMGDKIARTESMNLLINNWQNVAGSGDTFRNFACNDADLMFTKMQKSINNIEGCRIENTIKWWEPRQTVTIIDVEEYKNSLGWDEVRYVASISGTKVYLEPYSLAFQDGTFCMVQPRH